MFSRGTNYLAHGMLRENKENGNSIPIDLLYETVVNDREQAILLEAINTDRLLYGFIV